MVRYATHLFGVQQRGQVVWHLALEPHDPGLGILRRSRRAGQVVAAAVAEGSAKHATPPPQLLQLSLIGRIEVGCAGCSGAAVEAWRGAARGRLKGRRRLEGRQRGGEVDRGLDGDVGGRGLAAGLGRRRVVWRGEVGARGGCRVCRGGRRDAVLDLCQAAARFRRGCGCGWLGLRVAHGEEARQPMLLSFGHGGWVEGGEGSGGPREGGMVGGFEDGRAGGRGRGG